MRPEDETPDPPKQMSLSRIKSKFPIDVKQREALVSHAGRQLERSLTYVKAIGIGLCGVCIGYGLHYFINSGNSDVIVTVLQDLPTVTADSREPTTMVMSMFGGLFVR